MLPHNLIGIGEIEDMELAVALSQDQHSTLLSSRNWQKLKKILPHCEKWQLTQLYLYDVKDNSLLSPLLHIEFSNLTMLSIGHNNLQSIEILWYIDAPNLHTILIDHNQIWKARPLFKLSRPKWKSLSMADNCIVDLHEIGRFRTAQNMEFINLEHFAGINPHVAYDLRPLMKCQLSKFKTMRLDGQSEQFNRKIHPFLMQKKIETRRRG